MERRIRRSTLILCFTLTIAFTTLQLITGPGPPSMISNVIKQSLPFAAHGYSQPLNDSYPLQQLHSDDYNRLIDFAHFNFTILNTSCNDTWPLLLIVVHSAPANRKRRMCIRQTWGQKRDNVLLLFAFGHVGRKTQKALDAENATYGDCIQGNFVDAYTNLTYKHAMLFKYAIYHCPTAKYILKTDDDVFVNSINLMELLYGELGPHGAHDLLFCNVRRKPIVNRSYRSKWRVSFREYAESFFPDMCPGWTVLYSTDVLFKLYKALQRAKYFWIDDALITGILRLKVNLTLQDNSMWVLPHGKLRQLDDDDDSGFVFDPFSFLYALPDTTFDRWALLWNYTKRFARGRHNVSIDFQRDDY